MSGSIAVIGAGFHSSRNILPAAVLAGLHIRALATRSQERSAAALLRTGSTGTPYGSATALLADPAIDRVAVIAQPSDQARLAIEALQAGKHVFADKPLGWTSTEAAEIADLAEAGDRVLMVGFMKRYAPIYRQLTELLATGDLGTVRSFGLTFGCDSTPFCATAEEFVKLAAIHVIDLVRFLFGEVDRVSVQDNSDGDQISLVVGLRMANGVVGSLELSGTPAYRSETEILRVNCSRGRATAENLATLTVHRAQPDRAASWQALSETTTVHTAAESAMSGVDRDLYLRGFVGQLAGFMAAVDSGTVPVSSGRDNVLTMALCEQILR